MLKTICCGLLIAILTVAEAAASTLLLAGAGVLRAAPLQEAGSFASKRPEWRLPPGDDRALFPPVEAGLVKAAGGESWSALVETDRALNSSPLAFHYAGVDMERVALYAEGAFEELSERAAGGGLRMEEVTPGQLLFLSLQLLVIGLLVNTALGRRRRA